MFRKNKIVIGKVTKIDLMDGLYVDLINDIKGFVPLDHIGNIPQATIKQYFSRHEYYKFRIIEKKNDEEGLVYLSYKLCHPYLIENKNKIIATSNNFKNLKNALLSDMSEYKKTENSDN